MSRTDFEEIFTSFRQKFPPVETTDDAVLKLSTEEVDNMILDFWPNIIYPREGITRFMIAQGYKYCPIEVNERVRFFWLIGQDPGS